MVGEIYYIFVFMELLFEIKSKRYIYLIMAVFALGFTVLFYWAGYAYKGPINGEDGFSLTLAEDIPLMQSVISSVIMLIGIAIVYLSIRTYFVNAPLFSIFDKGFISNTHGISSGLIEWKDVDSIEETIITRNESRGRISEGVLVIYFKDKDYYIKKQNSFLRWVMYFTRATKKYNFLGQLNTNKESYPMIIPLYSFGKDAVIVVGLMNKLIEKSKVE